MATYSLQLSTVNHTVDSTVNSRSNHYRARWRQPNLTALRFGMLTLGSLFWVAIYSGLMRRLWQGAALIGPISLLLMVASVVLGVLLIVAWWRFLAQQWSFGGFGGWAALSHDQLLRLTPSEFEEYVTQRIFARRGMQAYNTPNVKDGGIDILLTDRNGQKAVVQCKRYRNAVGEETVRDLYGTMMHNQAAHAYLVTTARISDAARRFSAGKNIDLIDGVRLVELGR